MENRFYLCSHHPGIEGLHHVLNGKFLRLVWDEDNTPYQIEIHAKMDNGDRVVMGPVVNPQDYDKAKKLVELIEHYENEEIPYEVSYFKFMYNGYAIGVCKKQDRNEYYPDFSGFYDRFVFVTDSGYFDKNQELDWDRIRETSKKFARDFVATSADILMERDWDSKWSRADEVLRYSVYKNTLVSVLDRD